MIQCVNVKKQTNRLFIYYSFFGYNPLLQHLKQRNVTATRIVCNCIHVSVEEALDCWKSNL